MKTKALALAVIAALAPACQRTSAPTVPRASGYVEATEVRVASEVPGRVSTVAVVEGVRVNVGETLVTIAPTDIDLALDRARAVRDEADATLRLARAGSRPEDIRQADAQVAAADADGRAARADLLAAQQDEQRFEQLLTARAGSVKQRDDAVARRAMAEARVKADDDRAHAAAEQAARLRAGSRPEEIEAARARLAGAQAQIATLQKDRTETTVIAPTSGVLSSRLVEPGELIAAGTPLLVIVDLDHAWANVYVEEPLVPQLKIDDPATLVTDAGQRLSGHIAFISPQAEFTPRNVQTTAERAKLVYRVKVLVDNRAGVLKPGMPVEAEFTGARR
jgi:HlyD family secretion protein